MSEEQPSASELKEMVLSSGKSEEEWNAKIEEYRQNFAKSGMIQNEDFLAYVVAQSVFKVSVPKMTTLGKRGPRGPVLELRLRDVDRKFAKESMEKGNRFKFKCWVFGQRDGQTSKSSNKVTMTITDGESAVRAAVQGDKPTERWKGLGIKDGDYIGVDGADLFTPDDEKATFVQIGLGVAEITKFTAEKDIFEIARDSAKVAAPHGGIARVRGFVTDENARPVRVCMVCGTSEKGIKDGRGKNCCKTSVKGEIFWRSCTVANGSMMATVTFSPDLGVNKDAAFFGKMLDVIGVWNKDNEEYGVVTYRVSDQIVLRKHEEVFSQAPVKPATTQNVYDTFKQFVGNYGEIPEKAVLRGLRLKLQKQESEAQSMIEEQIKAGLIARKGTNLVWVGEAAKPTAKTPPAQKEAPAAPVHEANGNGLSPETVLQKVKELAEADPKGADFDKVVTAFGDQDKTEKIVVALMDDGKIYEPILGRLKLS